jgi:hypothetical protein
MSRKDREGRNEYAREYYRRDKIKNETVEDFAGKIRVMIDDASPNQKAQLSRLYADMMGYTKNVSKEFEIDPSEYIAIGRELFAGLRDEYENTGCCPVCGFSKKLQQIRQDSGPEQGEGDNVETLGISG